MTNKPETLPAVKDDLFLYSGRRVSNITNHLVIEFNETIQVDLLKKAFKLSIQSETILQYKFQVPTLRKPRWVLDKDIDPDSLFEFVEANDSDDMESLSKEFLHIVLHPLQDNQIKLRLIRHESDKLIIKINHIAADGGAMAEYTSRLADTYSNLLNDQSYIPKNISGDRSLDQIYKQFSFKEKLNIIPYSFKVIRNRMFPRGNWSLPLKNGSDHDPKFLKSTIENNSYVRLKSFCKHNGLTVNDTITALYIRALYGLIKPPKGTPIRMVSTISLRRYLPSGVGQALCNLSSVLIINIGHKLGENLAHTSKKVHDEVEWQKNSYLGLNSHRSSPLNLVSLPYPIVSTINTIFGLFGFLIIDSAKLPPLFSNTGRFTEKNFNFEGTSIKNLYFYAPVSYYPVSFVSATGFESKINICATFNEDVIAEKIMQSIFSTIEEEIEQL